MPERGAQRIAGRLARVGIWFASVLLAVALFSLTFSLLAGSAGAESVPLIFRMTLIFALPVGCLYLPVVWLFADARGRRFWTILCSGVLIGPVSMALWGLVLELRGGESREIWHGDPLTGIGGFACMVFALIVGTLATLSYLVSLRALNRK